MEAMSIEQSQKLRQRLVDQFEQMLSLVEPHARHLYSLSWPLLTSQVNQAMSSRHDIRRLINGNPLSVMHTNHACHANFIQSVLRLRSSRCLVEVVIWVYRSYIARGFDPDYFRIELAAWKQAIHATLQPRTEITWLLGFYDALIENHENFYALSQTRLEGDVLDNEMQPYVQSFLDSLIEPDEQQAEDLTRDYIKAAADVPIWWEDVITPALRMIGRLWSEDQLTVAQEHIATAMTQRILSRCFPALPRRSKPRGMLAVVVPPGEIHDVGASMVRDCLQLAGFGVLFTGANTPIHSVQALLEYNELDALMISTTLPFNLPAVEDMIGDIREHHALADLPIIVGGQAYDSDPALATKVGADALIARPTELVSYLSDELAVA